MLLKGAELALHGIATILTMILLVVAVVSPILSFSDFVVLRIRFVLSNGVPLGNATVTYKYSRVSTQTVTNTTDRDGFVILRINNEWVGDGYHPIIIVSYGFYGEIYRSEFNDVNSIPETVILPYTLLYKKSVITDEYLRGLNGSYRLFYNNIFLKKGFFHNGLLIINETFNGGFLLLSTEDASFNYKYSVVVDVNNTSITLHLPDLNDHLILDLYKPRVSIKSINASMGVNEVLYLYANASVYDGVNTNNTSIKGVFIVGSGTGVIERDARIISSRAGYSGISLLFKASIFKASLPPSSNGSYTITFKVSATDPTGKSSKASRSITYSIGVESTGRTSISEPATENSVGSNTSTIHYEGENTGNSGTTTSNPYNSGFGAGVNPGVQTSNLGYFTAPIIALAILFLELRRRIGGGSASPGSS